MSPLPKSLTVPILEWFELEALYLWRALGFQLLDIAKALDVPRHTVVHQIYRGKKAQHSIRNLESWKEHAAHEASTIADLIAQGCPALETISLEAEEAAEMFLRASPKPDCPAERIQELGILDAGLSSKDGEFVIVDKLPGQMKGRTLDLCEAQAIVLWHREGYTLDEIYQGMKLPKAVVRGRIYRESAAERRLSEITCWRD